MLGIEGMQSDIYQFEAIGVFHANRLSSLGIKTMDDLLRHCSSKRARHSYAKRAGISADLILRWANLADLMRISGISDQYARLLKASDIGTIDDLRRQNPYDLRARLVHVNSLRRISRTIPSNQILAEWIAHAKAIQPFVC